MGKKSGIFEEKLFCQKWAVKCAQESAEIWGFSVYDRNENFR
jgi:hypothetical protein